MEELTDTLSIGTDAIEKDKQQSNDVTTLPKKRGRPPKKPTESNIPTVTPNIVQHQREEAYGELGRRFNENPSKIKGPSSKSKSEKEIEEELKIVLTIEKYYKGFPKLSQIDIRGLTIEKLKEELARIKKELGTVDSSQFFNSMDIILAGFLESQAVPRGLPLQNLTLYSKTHQEIVEDELKELNILYGGEISLGPIERYVMKFAQRVYEVSRINRGMGNVSQRVNPENINKYDNL